MAHKLDRVCQDCGDVKRVGTVRDAKSPRCVKCSNIHRKKTYVAPPPVLYYYFCPSCPDIRISNKKHQRKTGLCKKCSCIATGFNRRGVKKPRPKLVKYFRTCIDCGDVKEVKSLASSKALRCAECSRKPKVKIFSDVCKVKEKVIKPKPKPRPNQKQYYVKKVRTTKTVSQEAIDKAREANKKHRESERNRTISEIIKASQEEHDSMIADFLSKNEPSTTIRDEPIPHFEQQMWMKD